MKLWMKCPFPGEPSGEGVWFECNTPYLRRLWGKHKKNKWLPVLKQKEKPDE